VAAARCNRGRSGVPRHPRSSHRPPTTLVIAPLNATQVTLPKLDLSKFTDSYFKSAEEKKTKKKGEDEFFKVRFAEGGYNAVFSVCGCALGVWLGRGLSVWLLASVVEGSRQVSS